MSEKGLFLNLCSILLVGSLVPILTASTQDLTSSQQNVSSCSSNNTVVLELSVCDSDDTIILDEDCFPSRKRQKTNEDAKQVS